MNNFFKKRNKGDSLIEMLIYVVLFTIFSIVFINSVMIMTKTYTRIRGNNAILDSSTSSMNRITSEIRNAVSVDSAHSTLDASPGVLTLNTTDSNGNAKVVKFDVSNGAVRLTENSVVTGNITSSNVTVTNLVFRLITTIHGYAIKVEMTLRDNKITTHTENFYDTSILRGAY